MAGCAPTAVNQVTRQRVLDAIIDLQCCRRSAIDALARGPRADAEVVASGDLTGWIIEESHRWRHMLSIRATVCASSLVRSLPNNRQLIDGGLVMISVFDHDSTEETARQMLEGEPPHTYFYGFAPLQLKIVDRSSVLLQGPTDGDEPSLLLLRSPRAMAAAWAYWHAVTDTVFPCRPGRPDDGVARLTRRQVEVLEMLRADLTDDQIARALSLSVRTVRSDVGSAMAALGVRSRFAAGFAYAALARDSSLRATPDRRVAATGPVARGGRLPRR